MMRYAWFLMAWAFVAPAVADERPLGEPLTKAAAKYGLTDADVRRVMAAGGEFACPNDRDVSLLNAWLISDRQIITNAHSIIEGEEKPGRPYIRQPVFDCVFTSYLELKTKKPVEYKIDLSGLGAVLRRGAKAPMDPQDAISSDVLRFKLKHPVADAAPLEFDFSPLAKGDSVMLVSRVPTKYQTKTLPGDDLLIERCSVIAVSGNTGSYSQSATTDCNGAPGMSAGVLFSRKDGRLVARGFLVSIDVRRDKDSHAETTLASHNLVFDAKFRDWLRGDCAFWPSALRISFCGVNP